MQLDDVNVKILAKIAENKNMNINKASSIVEGFYKGLIEVMSTQKAVIKVDYFGKFIYSEDWKEKKEKIREQYNFSDLNIV